MKHGEERQNEHQHFCHLGWVVGRACGVASTALQDINKEIPCSTLNQKLLVAFGMLGRINLALCCAVGFDLDVRNSGLFSGTPISHERLDEAAFCC